MFRSHQGLLFVAVGIAELRPLSVFRQWRSLRFSLDLTLEEERGPGLSAMPDQCLRLPLAAAAHFLCLLCAGSCRVQCAPEMRVKPMLFSRSLEAQTQESSSASAVHSPMGWESFSLWTATRILPISLLGVWLSR